MNIGVMQLALQHFLEVHINAAKTRLSACMRLQSTTQARMLSLDS